ncbi:MAG: hypothetical protein VKJ09_02115 [Leptolyngbya sp.]|nr:hypothetical protein [Leptolyngbya sp.]
MAVPTLAQMPPPPVAPSAAATGEQYVVYVNGNSPLLLEQVRQVEPGAFINTINGRRVIQVGRFSNLDNAQRQVQTLNGFGLGAVVTTVAAVTTAALPPPPGSGYPPTVSNVSDLPPLPTVTPGYEDTTAVTAPLPAVGGGDGAVAIAPNGYYVVVPTGGDQLSTVANRIVQLGAPSTTVQQRQSPRGPHVAVGPFSDRALAEQWSHYLRGSGLDARVHHE